MNWERNLPRLLGGVVVLLLVAAIAYAITTSSTLPDGPVDVVWDKAACAHCRMHVGEPRFAAQIVQRDGATAVFDDPGCLFAFLAAERPAVHAIWFHALLGDGWLRAPDVAFATVPASPMGFGLGAVPVGTPLALDYAAACAHCAGGPPAGGNR
jgi:hypothetical protein